MTRERLVQRSRNQTGICPPLPPTRFPGGITPTVSLCSPCVIASEAKQSPIPGDPRLLRFARNDTMHISRSVLTLLQNAVIERLAKEDGRVSCRKNRKMADSSTETIFRVFGVFRGKKTISSHRSEKLVISRKTVLDSVGRSAVLIHWVCLPPLRFQTGCGW